MCVIYLFAGLGKLTGSSMVGRLGHVDSIGNLGIPVVGHDMARELADWSVC